MGKNIALFKGPKVEAWTNQKAKILFANKWRGKKCYWVHKQSLPNVSAKYITEGRRTDRKLKQAHTMETDFHLRKNSWVWEWRYRLQGHLCQSSTWGLQFKRQLLRNRIKPGSATNNWQVAVTPEKKKKSGGGIDE